MQLNTVIATTMAASEPPEPPPRNPEKINVSLKPTTDAKIMRTVDSLAVNNNNSINNNNSSGFKNSSDQCNDEVKPTNETPTTVSNCTVQLTETSMTTPASATETSEYVSVKTSSATNADECSDEQLEQPVVHSIDTALTATTTDKDSPETPTLFELGTNMTPKGRDTSTEHSDNEVKLKLENDWLTNELNRLKQLFEYSEDCGAVGGVEIPLSDNNSLDAHSTDGSVSRIERLEMDLKTATEQIAYMKVDRRKLKIEKADLLSHVKQLCASLQDKEQEMREFIRNFEQRIRDTDAINVKASNERERERWSLLKQARDESERSLELANQLNARDVQLQRMQEQLLDARRQLTAATGCSDQESLLSFAPLTPPPGPQGPQLHHMSGGISGFGSMMLVGDHSAESMAMQQRASSDRDSETVDINNVNDESGESRPCIGVDTDSISLASSRHNMYQYVPNKEFSPTVSPLNTGSYSRSIDVGLLSRSVEHLGTTADVESRQLIAGGDNGASSSVAGVATTTLVQRRLQLASVAGGSTTGTLGSRSGRGGTWGSISRVFARSRHRNKNAASAATSAADGSAHADGGSPMECQWSTLTEGCYADKLKLLREASAVPMERWRASQVLAWLEVALGMPQYAARCSENVKSGKVLLELTDGELETGLGLVHPMHRKKMRLAIEEQRRPDLQRYPSIGQLGHTWVAAEWLVDIGLTQYADSFMHSLVDARMLDTLSKKELEKFLSVTRKFHQASIVHGIHVLRILKYDRQSLLLRRMQCENVDADPIVWTNHRFIRWARSIDLGEYADNLKDSGVHGGLVVLEPSFSGDTIATALGIPPSKHIIRRHLTTEFDALVLPARAQLGQGIRIGGGSVMPITGPGGLHQHANTQQHHHSVDRRNNGNLRFAAWRGSQGSLYKALGFSSTKGRRSERPFSAGAVGSSGGGGGCSTSPTPSYSSSSENGIYATIGPAAGKNQHLRHNPHGPTGQSGVQVRAATGGYTSAVRSEAVLAPPPASHRVSAPPMEAALAMESAMPQYAQHHRRVKSISDIEVVAATPV